MGLEGKSRMEPEDRVTGPGQSEGMQQGRTGWEKRVTDLGEESRQIWSGGRTDWGKRRDGWFRPDMEEGMGQTWGEKETGTGRRSQSWGRGSEKHWTDGGDGAEKSWREDETVSGESLEFEFGTGSPGAGSDEAQSRQRPQGPRGHSCGRRADHECPGSMCESMPACGWVCKCVRLCLSALLVCECVKAGLSVCMGG